MLLNWQWEIEEENLSDKKKDQIFIYNLAAMLTVEK